MVQQLKNSTKSIAYRVLDRFNKPAIVTPTWQMNEQALEQAKVYWPTEYQWAPSEVFLEPVRLGMAHWAKLEHRPIPQPFKGVCVFELELDNSTHRIAIDYSDYVDRIERSCLATVSLYFKMQYLRDGYDLSSNERRKLIPGGYVTGDRRITSRFAAIREQADRPKPQFNIYGRFGMEFATEIRTAAVMQLRSDPTLGYEGGMHKVPYRQSLLDASHSKICIDLPGNGDFCFRLFDYLAVGAFVIAYPHNTTLPIPLINGYHLVYMKPDLSNLVELCNHYLDHASERHAIQQNAAAYFDTNVNHLQLGSWYLQQSLNMAIAAPESFFVSPLLAPRYRQSAA